MKANYLNQFNKYECPICGAKSNQKQIREFALVHARAKLFEEIYNQSDGEEQKEIDQILETVDFAITQAFKEEMN
jgi:hypothetical protein